MLTLVYEMLAAVPLQSAEHREHDFTIQDAEDEHQLLRHSSVPEARVERRALEVPSLRARHEGTACRAGSTTEAS